MAECPFCAIIAGNAAGTIVFADDDVVALIPPEPLSRVHLLLMPRAHVSSVDALTSNDAGLWMHLLLTAQRLARRYGIDVEREAYSLGTNAGRDAIRKYAHLHIWLMDGAREQ
jgi:histidine triad (HIT) family protein